MTADEIRRIAAEADEALKDLAPDERRNFASMLFPVLGLTFMMEFVAQLAELNAHLKAIHAELSLRR